MNTVFEEKCRRAFEAVQMPLPVTELGFGEHNGESIFEIHMDASGVENAPKSKCSAAIVFKVGEEPTDEAIERKLFIAVRAVQMNLSCLPA